MAKKTKSPAVKVRSTRATPRPAARATMGTAAKRKAAARPSGKAAVSAKPKRTAATPARAAGPKATKAAGAEKATKAAAKPAKAAPGRGKLKASKPTPMFQKVAFTMFYVSDPTRARVFYEDVLGFSRGLASANGFWTEYDLPGGGCLALFNHPDPAFARPAGGASIAFEVADLDALNERLKQRGVVYQGDVVHGPNCRMSNILDSEGNSLILHQLNHEH